MAGILWTVTLLLAAQLLFTVWNLAQLRPLGGTGKGREALDRQPAWNQSQDQEQGTAREGEQARGQAQESMQEGEQESGQAQELVLAQADKQEHERGAESPSALLSILIPARNEAGHIAACLQSVLAEPSTRIEVLVLDDQSSDGTGEIARAAAAGDSRCRILSGERLPAGWSGKSHACSQLAEAARGEWLLFLDADARLEAGALGAALDTAFQQGGGLVTGFPYQETSSWLEKLVVPLMNFTIACHLPILLIRRSSDPRFVAAHGAFLLIARQSYDAIGGHGAFRAHLVDDMQLARSVKAAGLPVTLSDVSGFVHMRMYSDAAGVWNGYKKNIFEGVGRSAPLLGGMLLLYFILYVLPPLSLLGYGLSGLLEGELGAALLPAACAWMLGLLLKRAVDAKSRHPILYALLLPPGMLALAGIGIASWRASTRSMGYEWKGRRYP